MKREDYDLAFMLQYENVAWYENGQVKILDRRIYPREIKYVYCNNHREVAQAITDMVTQSAGPYTAAGMGMALAGYESRDLDTESQTKYLRQAANTIANARPTTANRLRQVVDRCLIEADLALKKNKDVDEAIFKHTIKSLNNRYSIMNDVAKYLVDMFPEDGKIMTQCFGETIVGMMLRQSIERKKNISLYTPETRPYLQGSRLTASVGLDMGIDTTIITDNMPAFVMKEKDIDIFTSAADSICLDGYVVNKIGTLQMAIVAKYFGIPYFVTGIPDIDNKTIDDVVIEERNPKDILEINGVRMTKENAKAYYPSFDITPPELVSGVITDKGIYSPYDLERYFEDDFKDFY